MKILLLHSYGKDLGGWNTRIKRQIELMSERCTLEVLTIKINKFTLIDRYDFEVVLKKKIKEFEPDVVYVVGPIMGDIIIDYHDRVVYDMGTFFSINLLIENQRYGYKDLLKYSREELEVMLKNGREYLLYEIEKRAIDHATAIINWDNKEVDFAETLFGKKIERVSMAFTDLPKPIPFDQKEDRIISYAAKWGRPNKNGRLLDRVELNMSNNKNIEHEISTIGYSGGKVNFIPHDKLMDELNRSKVLFCPYLYGGCGTIIEGLKLGCNVVIGYWHQFDTYVNKELIIPRGKSVPQSSVNTILKALEKEYKCKTIPTEEEQLNKIMDICYQTLLKKIK